MDFDPRDYDSRDDERFRTNQSRGSRGGSDEGDDDWPHRHRTRTSSAHRQGSSNRASKLRGRRFFSLPTVTKRSA